jgi:SAM-dependent methyltransferase
MEQGRGPNAEQETLWNGPGGAGWARRFSDVDAMLGEVTERALARAQARPGATVIDLGCGAGSTTLALARAVGPGGRATGYDLSEPQLEVARRRARAEQLAHAAFVRADIQIEPLGVGAELAFSRFGIMFGADPLALFANVRAALGAGGRLGALVWRSPAENPWFQLIVAEVAKRLPAAAAPPPSPEAPGPFALADAARTQRLLEQAGFEAVRLEPWDFALRFASADQAWDLQRDLSSVLRSADAALADAAREDLAADLRSVMSRYATPQGLAIPGAVWWVTAQVVR